MDIPDGETVFLDANTLVYHYGPHPVLQAACQELLERIAQQEIFGVTSAHALGDVAHRLMTVEAMAKFGRSVAGIARHLRRHPSDVQSLVQFRKAVDEVPQLGVQVVPISQQLVSAAAVISQQHGLLSGDALVVAVMRHHNLTHMASHDADFDRVPGITRYAPV